MASTDSSNPQSTRCIPAAIGLVFLAPLVAEFLLGNLPIKMLSALIVLAPFYGGGALLIRETTRRAGRGWPTIVLLALAYGIVEEAFTTQTLFNPNYMHLNLHLLDSAYIPALGIGAWWTLFVLALHTIWSISVPIALIEATVPRRASTPWLGNLGLAITAVVFLAGAAANTAIGFRTDRFLSSPAQFATSAAAVILLVVVAFRLPRPANADAASSDWVPQVPRLRGPGSQQITRVGASRARSIPSPWLFGFIALAAGSAILLVPKRWGWWAAAIIPGLELGVAVLVIFFSRRTGWQPTHKLALAAGAAVSYAWHAFIQKPVVPGSILQIRIGNAIFALGAVLLIVFAASRLRAAGQTQASNIRLPRGSPASQGATAASRRRKRRNFFPGFVSKAMTAPAFLRLNRRCPVAASKVEEIS